MAGANPKISIATRVLMQLFLRSRQRHHISPYNEVYVSCCSPVNSLLHINWDFAARQFTLSGILSSLMPQQTLIESS